MFGYHPVIKIFVVLVVCLGALYLNYLMLNTEDYVGVVKDSWFLKIAGLFYVLTILLFADLFKREKRYLLLMLWLALNASLVINFSIYITGINPPLWLQYTQSGSLMVFMIALIFIREIRFNWFRIFSLAGLLILIPCVLFYFAEWWFLYEVTIYLLCFTPLLLAVKFLQDIRPSINEVLDRD